MRLSTDDITLTKGARYHPSFTLNDRSILPYVDAWQKQKAPSDKELLAHYERIAFTCVTNNVNGCLAARLRLYTFNKSSRLKTASVDYARRTKLTRNSRLKLHLASQANIEEVIDHDFLDLWFDPNPRQTAVEFQSYYHLYQDVLGHAYVKFVPDRTGRLQEWWILPSHMVKPERDQDYVVHGFRFDGGFYPLEPNGTEPYIKAFCALNPHDPYSGVGISPLRAAFEPINLEEKMMATEAAILDNEGRPSGILSPEEPIGAAEAKRWEHKYETKFRKSGNGKVLVSEEKFNFTPLTFPPKDLAALEVARATKAEVALAFGNPPALLESNQFNRATLEASIVLHVRQGIQPRLRAFEEHLNKYVLPLYGGNLFVAFDDPSPDDEKLRADRLRNLVDGGIYTRNEARLELDHQPHPDGDGLSGLPGQDIGTGETETEATEAPPTGAVEDIQQTALNGAQIDSLVELALSLGRRELPPETVRALIGAAFPSLTQQQIASIVDPLLNFEPPKAEAVAEAPKPPEAAQEPDEPEGKSLIVFGNPPPNDRLAKLHETLSEMGIETKAQRQWKEPPTSPELEKVVAKFFAKYRQSALAQVKKDMAGKVRRKDFVPLSQATDELAKEARLFIEIAFINGGKELSQQVGFDEDIFSVTNPEVRKAIDKAAFDFADSTNETTTLKLNEALEKLRQELGEGVDVGERITELTKRVNEIFEGLEKSHSRLIAMTESSRAFHEGQRQAAKDSGVVKGFELLLSPDACEVCKAVAAQNKRIDLDGHFLMGEGTYGKRLVPLHPGCRCTMLSILDIQA